MRDRNKSLQGASVAIPVIMGIPWWKSHLQSTAMRKEISWFCSLRWVKKLLGSSTHENKNWAFRGKIHPGTWLSFCFTFVQYLGQILNIISLTLTHSYDRDAALKVSFLFWGFPAHSSASRTEPASTLDTKPKHWRWNEVREGLQ